jgi:hypothetical protein
VCTVSYSPKPVSITSYIARVLRSRKGYACA